MRLILFMFFFSLSNVIADQIEEQYYSDLEKITNRLFCHDQATLSYINKDYSACLSYINFLSKECAIRFTMAKPRFESIDEFIKHDQLLNNLVDLYISCVKVKIYEDIEGVVMLNRSSQNLVE